MARRHALGKRANVHLADLYSAPIRVAAALFEVAVVPPATMGEAAAEERGLLGGTAEEQEKAPAELCGTPAQQRGFVWFAFYAIAVSCGLVLRHASRLERGLDLEKQMSPDVWAIDMLNCANLRCHASVTTSVAFPTKSGEDTIFLAKCEARLVRERAAPGKGRSSSEVDVDHP